MIFVKYNQAYLATDITLCKTKPTAYKNELVDFTVMSC